MVSAITGFDLTFGLGSMFGGGCSGDTDCYAPTAQKNVHTAIGELLQFPYKTNDSDYYKINQLITYSNERDVIPFQEEGILDNLYGLPRPANIGLFSMPEAKDHLHIGY